MLCIIPPVSMIIIIILLFISTHHIHSWFPLADFLETVILLTQLYCPQLSNITFVYPWRELSHLDMTRAGRFHFFCPRVPVNRESRVPVESRVDNQKKLLKIRETSACDMNRICKADTWVLVTTVDRLKTTCSMKGWSCYTKQWYCWCL